MKCQKRPEKNSHGTFTCRLRNELSGRRETWGLPRADGFPGSFFIQTQGDSGGKAAPGEPCVLFPVLHVSASQPFTLRISRWGDGDGSAACLRSPFLSQRTQLSFEARPLEPSIFPQALTCSNRFARLVCKNSCGAFIF